MTWLMRRENPSGEWCVVDLRRGYRLCAYNHKAHGGPHLHTDRGEVVRIDVDHPGRAEAMMRSYAAEHDEFDLARFRKEVLRWRSVSRND